jgi:hypothetical protein
MIGFAAALIIVSMLIQAFTGTVFLIVLGLVPLLFILGIAGLISPNVIRGMGQHGGHLPSHYKFIGWGVTGFSILLMIPIMILMYQAGFRTNVPRPKPRLRQVAPPASSRPIDQVAKQNGTPSVAADARIAKRRKSYPVSIAVPDHSVFVPADAKLNAGTKLEACFAGAWNPITTLSENDDGSLNVRWDDWGPQFDCSMIRGELIVRREVLKGLDYPMASLPAVTTRPSTSGKPSGLAPQSAKKPLKSYLVTIAVPADSQLVPAGARLPSGTRLQACYLAKWNPITLLAENDDGTLTVRWDDYGEAFDCRMIRSELIVKQSLLK